MEHWERKRISQTHCLHLIDVGGMKVALDEFMFNRRVILPPQSVRLLNRGSVSCRVPALCDDTWKWKRFLKRKFHFLPMMPQERVAFLTVLMLGEFSSMDRSCVTDIDELKKLLKKRKSHGKKR